MDLPPRRHHTKILAERASTTKVERATARIGNDPAGLFDEERSWCVVLRRNRENCEHSA
jgi:hypothetical protein